MLHPVGWRTGEPLPFGFSSARGSRSRRGVSQFDGTQVECGFSEQAFGYFEVDIAPFARTPRAQRENYFGIVFIRDVGGAPGGMIASRKVCLRVEGLIENACSIVGTARADSR